MEKYPPNHHSSMTLKEAIELGEYNPQFQTIRELLKIEDTIFWFNGQK